MPSARESTDFFRRQSWRLLNTGPEPGPTNMAIDEALLHRASRSGEAVLRVYSWCTPTLSIGRHQRATGAYDADHARALGISLVRRITGGRSLLHWREVTYSVTAPIGTENLAQSYGAINEVLVAALQSLDVPVTIAERSGRQPGPASAPCFEFPAAGEILFDGKKLVGSAQFRNEAALLQHGSILLADDQPLVTEIATEPVGDVAAAATLTDALGATPALGDVAAALRDALAFRTGSAPLPLDPNEIADDVARLREHYASDAWTWQR
ncbi:MAG: Octanoyltransferase LipM [Gemmatimonadaceae bacterium]|nr:Octanoyltransferase LipM [Gemmatimonadaceae bacterium]